MPATKRANWIVQLRLQDPDTEAWLDLGRWAVLEGGGATSDQSAYHDWDRQVQLGGVKTRDDATIKRLFGRHANEVYSTLDSWVARARAELSRMPTNDAGVVNGPAIKFTGIFAGLGLSDVEKGSAEGTEIMLTFNLDADLA